LTVNGRYWGKRKGDLAAGPPLQKFRILAREKVEARRAEMGKEGGSREGDPRKIVVQCLVFGGPFEGKTGRLSALSGGYSEESLAKEKKERKENGGGGDTGRVHLATS